MDLCKRMIDFNSLDSSWQGIIEPEIQKPYLQDLQRFLDAEIERGEIIYPPHADIFRSFYLTKFSDVKIVIVGQDPYHGKGQAHGLAFSVCEGVKIPPSLQNIFKEISREYNCEIPSSGDLTHWAKQGVLLLNATLTVRANEAGSHQKQGWELFTDEIICALAARSSPIVFMLWGAYAQKKAECIDQAKHLILTAPHPSPLSAHRGFIGCGHFRTANEFLKKNGRGEISWG